MESYQNTPSKPSNVCWIQDNYIQWSCSKTQFVASLLSKFTLSSGKRGNHSGHWQKERNPVNVPGSSQVLMILKYAQWWKLIRKIKTETKQKYIRILKCQRFVSQVPLINFAQSVKQKKTKRIHGHIHLWLKFSLKNKQTATKPTTNETTGQ